jgi:endonuclease/exonuclease/phosphatase family metal-dependent hydrolase
MRLPLRRRGERRQKPARGESAIVVATYNIHTCVGVDRRYDPERIATVLRELNADIIGLQEVDARHRDKRRLDQWAYFAEETGLVAVPGPNAADRRRGRFGNALLTRWPVLGVRRIDLSVKGYEPRGAIDADLLIENRVLRVVATHFGLHGPERRLQAQRVLDAIAVPPANGAAPADAVVIMGDLNEWRGRRGGIPALERRLGRAPAPRTFPSWCPVLPLDRIYAGDPVEIVTLEVHRSPLARIASDHLPLRAALRWGASDELSPQSPEICAERQARPEPS